MFHYSSEIYDVIFMFPRVDLYNRISAQNSKYFAYSIVQNEFLEKSLVYDDLLGYFSQALYLCSFVVFGDLSLSYSFDQKMSIAFHFSQTLGGRYQQNISRLKYLPRRFS